MYSLFFVSSLFSRCIMQEFSVESRETGTEIKGGINPEIKERNPDLYKLYTDLQSALSDQRITGAEMNRIGSGLKELKDDMGANDYAALVKKYNTIAQSYNEAKAKEQQISQQILTGQFEEFQNFLSKIHPRQSSLRGTPQNPTDTSTEANSGINSANSTPRNVGFSLGNFFSQPGREARNAYTEVAASLGSWIPSNFVNRGNNSCGESTGLGLNKFGIEGLPSSGRDGKNWANILDVRPDQFTKVKIDHPRDCKPGGIVCFDAGAELGTPIRKAKGHVEMMGDDRKFYSYYGSAIPGGSCAKFADPQELQIIAGNIKNPQRFRELTGFTGYVYYPKTKSPSQMV